MLPEIQTIKLNFEIFERFKIDTCTSNGEMLCYVCEEEFETEENTLSEFLELATEHLKTCGIVGNGA